MASSNSPASRIRGRSLGYVLAFLVVVFVFLLGFGLPGSPDGDLHTALEILSAIFAVLIGTLALIRFYVRRRSLYAWIGAGFLLTAFLDAYHGVAAGDLLNVSFLQSSPDFPSWSWFAGRTALSAFLLIAWLAYWRQTHKHPHFPVWAIYTIAVAAAFFAMIAQAVMPPPVEYSISGALAQPFELIPGFLFLVALIGFLTAGEWRTRTFDHALIIALVLSVGTQTLLMPFSQEANDPLFHIAHIAKIASYLTILIGLLASTYKVFKLAEERRMELLKKTFELREEREHIQRSLDEVADKERALKGKVVELETTRSAVLNVMEDLDIEKSNLAREKAKDEAILASVGEGLVVSDAHRRINYMNAAAQQMTQYRVEDIKGKRWPEIVQATLESGEAIPAPEYVSQRALNTLRTKSTFQPYRFTRRDGSFFMASVTASPVILADKPIGVISVFRDVSREREIDKAKSEFVSLASHQLRTPLSTIKWYIEMLLEGDAGKLKKDQLDYVEEVEHANERMVDLVNALLNVSRIELGTFAVQPQPTDVAQVAASVVRELQPQLEKKKIKLLEDYATNLPTFMADPNLIRIIVQNLLTNAIKYSPVRHKVKIKVSQMPAGKKVDSHPVRVDSLLIEVKDEGYGIPTAAQPKIFSKLFRADNVKEHETDGTGLGLYIVKSIVDHSDGDVWFESEENKGTTFWVLLPAQGMKAKKGAKQLT